MSVREHYTHHKMEDCYYEVFALCQEGMLSIKYENVEFEDGKQIIGPLGGGAGGVDDIFQHLWFQYFSTILYVYLKILGRGNQL